MAKEFNPDLAGHDGTSRVKLHFRALEKGGDLVDDTAMGIDTFTATIRGVISTHHELLGEAYGLEMGRRTVIQAGERIGIPPEETLKILEQAQGAARALHMNVKELH